MPSTLARESKTRDDLSMQELWQDIYKLCGGTRRHSDARRSANLVLALYVHSVEREQAAFFAALAEAAMLLGDPLPLAARHAAAIWARLQVEPKDTASDDEVDHWIEAFQAADSARKSLGAYATPAPFADALARDTLAPLIASRARHLRIIDPAAGAGSLLLAAHRCLVAAGYAPHEAVTFLHGVELDPQARELCVLLLWTAAGPDAPPLADIASNIRLANAVTLDWRALAPFDALLMNPPWESLRQSRSDAAQAQVREDTLARIASLLPGAEGLPPLYSKQGRGDRNLFKLFVELAPHLVREGGRYGALLPAAFGSDDGMAALREFYFAQFALERWTSFENRSKYFPIDSRYKFGLLTGTRAEQGTQALAVLSFCTHPQETQATHVQLGLSELRALGGTDYMIPELVHSTERDTLGQMMSKGTPLFESGPLGSVKYRREVDLTLGRNGGLFWHVDARRATVSARKGELCLEDTPQVVPLIEGRMISQYDCFEKSWVSGSGRRAIWEANGARPLEECRPQYMTYARHLTGARVAICDVTSATNTRTVLAALVPPHWVCGNTAPVLAFDSEDRALAGLAILNSMIFDWFARRTVGGLHLNKFYLARLTWPQLRPEDIVRLADLARIVAAAHPRGGVPSYRVPVPEEVLASRAEIETLVARGYDLGIDAVAAIFDTDRTNRRGLWRYFAANPSAHEVAARTLNGLALSPSLAA